MASADLMDAADLTLPAGEIVKDHRALRGHPVDDLARVGASLHVVVAIAADAITVAANTHAVDTVVVSMFAVDRAMAVHSLRRSTKTGGILRGVVGSQDAVGLAVAVTSKACIAAAPIVEVLR